MSDLLGAGVPINDVSAAQAHEILREDFTDRQIERAGMSKYAYSLAYNPESPLCDYQRTTWPCQPKFGIGRRLTGWILQKMHGMNKSQVEASFGQAFTERAEEIGETLKDSPLLIAADHRPDMLCALAGYSASEAIAKQTTKNPIKREANILDIYRMSHIVGTRSLAQVMIGSPDYMNMPFLRIGQLIYNPHFSLHRGKKMRESSLPEEFIKAYNARFIADCLKAVKDTPDNRFEFHSLWSMSPAGVPDKTDVEGLEGKKVMGQVNSKTAKLIGEMGCAVLPMYSSFDFSGNREQVAHIKLGDVIKPSQVSHTVLHDYMERQAEFRREHGEENVLYEGNLNLPVSH